MADYNYADDDIDWLSRHYAQASEVQESIFLEEVLRLLTIGFELSEARKKALSYCKKNVL